MKPSIEQVRHLKDFISTYNWNISIVRMPPVVQYPKDINIRAMSSDIPKLTTTRLTVDLPMGMRSQLPGSYYCDGQIQLGLVETDDAAVMTFIRSWRDYCKSVPKTLLFNETIIALQLLDRQLKPFYLFNLYGCFLESYDFGGALSDNNEILRPTLTIAYDYFNEGSLEGLLGNVMSGAEGILGTFDLGSTIKDLAEKTMGTIGKLGDISGIVGKIKGSVDTFSSAARSVSSQASSALGKIGGIF